MAKTLYHSELVKLGPVEVTVKSDILQSKYPGKPDYVVLEIAGEERNYSFDTPECATPFEGQKGQTFTIVAEGSGKDGSATVTYVGEGGGAPQRKAAPQRPAPARQPARQPAPAQRPAAPPQQQRPPVQHAAQSQLNNGAAIGQAVNKAVDYSIAASEEWDPIRIWERASDLLRISDSMMRGKLAKPFPERQARGQQEAGQ